MQTRRAQPRLPHGKTCALTTQQVADRHPDILEDHLGVGVGVRVMGKYRQVSNNLKTRRIGGHQHETLTLGLGRIGRCDADDNHHSAVFMRGIGTKPLTPINHILIAFADNAGFQVCWVRGRSPRFCHGKCRTYLTFQQGGKPLTFLLRRGEQLQQLHIRYIRSMAVKYP